MSIAELPRLYTDQEVADYLDVEKQTVVRERLRGRLSYTRIGKKIRITADHLKAYLENRECTATSTKERAAPIGTSTSTMNELDNARALALARQIVKPPRKSSPSTSSGSPSDSNSRTSR